MTEPTNKPTQQDTTPELIITRVYDAPRDLVWKAHSEAEQIAKWWGPKGFTIHVAKMEFRPDGVFHYAMRSKEGNEMWGKFVYREIVEPERIVFLNSFADATGKTARGPFSPTIPLEILNTLTFSEEKSKTTLTLHSTPYNATEEEEKTFASMLGSMQQGFKGTFDQLSDFLANR